MGIIRERISQADDEDLAAIMRGADNEVLARMFRQLPLSAPTRALGERCGGDVRAACAALEKKGLFVRASTKAWTYPVRVPEQKIGGNDDYGTPGDD